MKTAIVGSGVAGLAMANALATLPLGQDLVLLEQRTSAATEGFAFLLMPNGLAALRRLLPGFSPSAHGRRMARLHIHRADGPLLVERPMEDVFCVSRKALLEQLLRAAGSLDCRYSARAAGLRLTDDGRCEALVLDNGDAVEADVFLGCDGVRSAVRAQVFPDAELGKNLVNEVVVSTRSRALAASLGEVFHKFYDPEGGLAIGALAESDDGVVLFAQVDNARHALPARDPSGLQRALLSMTRGWCDQVRDLLHAMDFGSSYVWETRDLLPLPSLHRHNVALVGDAAHASLPFTSQGANGALEDAVTLAGLLEGVQTDPELAYALRAYDAARIPTHARVFRAGRELRAEFLCPSSESAPPVPLVD